MNMKPKLNRNESADYLKNNGYEISPKTLAKLACVGGGPAFQKFGHRVIYSPSDLLAWAESKTSSPIKSTSATLVGGE